MTEIKSTTPRLATEIEVKNLPGDTLEITLRGPVHDLVKVLTSGLSPANLESLVKAFDRELHEPNKAADVEQQDVPDIAQSGTVRR